MAIPGVREVESSSIKKIRVKLDTSFTNGHDFCELIIDDNNGRFTVVLYGGESYTHVFSSTGQKFVEFLANTFENDASYLYGKLHDHSKEQWCDAEKTSENMKKLLLKMRREKEIDEDEAREVFTRIEEMFNGEDKTSWDFFYSQYFDSLLNETFGPEPFHDDFMVSTYDVHCLVFCEKVAPILANVLRHEYQLTA